MSRRSVVERRTREVVVRVELALEPGDVRVETGYAMLDHLVETMLFHAGFTARIVAREARRVDDHHIAEDTAIALGEALRRAAGYMVKRFGYAVVPMDESLVLVALDYSGRPGAWVELDLEGTRVGDLAGDTIEHFIYSLAVSMRSTLHARKLHGGNAHHVAEAAFKALGLALAQALSPSARVPSVKGVLDVV
jgi:imidazoleglycerol-phosphate dehydratase